MLNLADKAFDQMPFLIQMTVIFSLMLVVRARWNHHLYARLFNLLNKRL